MKERPILFSAPMVRALLAGTKTQTRRIVKLKGAEVIEDRDGADWPWSPQHDEWVPSPYGNPGDRLWVREAFMVKHVGLCDVRYRATDNEPYLRWRPSIFMRRWASRITLEVTGVRVERLQEISEADAVAEGVRAVPLKEEWQAVRVSRDGSREMAAFESEPSAALVAEMNLEGVRHFPARPLVTAKQAYERLWESINGAGSWAANPWVWVVEFKRVKP